MIANTASEYQPSAAAQAMKAAGPVGALSVVAVGVCWYGSAVGAEVLYSVAAFLVYIFVITAPAGASLAGILLFAAGSLLCSPEATPHIARIALFALFLEATLRNRRILPPFIVLLILWSACIAAGSLPMLRELRLFTVDGDLLRQIILELFAVLVAPLLRLKDGVDAVLPGKRNLDTKTFFVNVVGLAVLLSVLCAGAGFIIATGSTFDQIVQRLLEKPHQLVATAASIAIIATAVGLFLAMVTGNFIAQLQAVASPSGTFNSALGVLPLLEFDAILKLLQKRTRDAAEQDRTAKRTISELRRIAEQKEEVIRQRELSALSMMKLMDEAPWGALSCSANGLVIAANRTFGEFTGLPHSSLPGQHISKLDSPHPWCKELHRLLVWGCRDYSKLIKQGPIHHFASPVRSHYLECWLCITRAAHSSTADSELVGASDVAITLFVRKVPDLRDFQLSLLSPSSFDLIGSQTGELIKQVRSRNSAVVSRLSMVQGLLNKPQGTSGWIMRQTEVGAEMLLQLGEMNKLTRETEEELAGLSELLAPRAGDVSEISLQTRLSHSINYLFDLLALDDRERFKLGNGGGADDRAVRIVASKSEINKFVAYFLALTKYLHTKAPSIEIDIAYENIDEHAAKIIPGSHPGDYARLTLAHRGQSLTANMMTSKFSYLDPSSGSRAESEAALSLVNMQVARLGGFVSVQSSPAKGTIITVYVPVLGANSEAAAGAAVAAKSKKHFRRKRYDNLGEAGNQAVVVGADKKVTTALSNMLSHLDYRVAVINPATMPLDGGRAVSFGGSGFGEGTSLDLLGEGAAETSDEQGVELRNADLLIINIEGGPEEALNLVHALEGRSEHAATLLVADPSPRIEQLFGDWALLRKPIELGSLEAAIKEATSRV